MLRRVCMNGANGLGPTLACALLSRLHDLSYGQLQLADAPAGMKLPPRVTHGGPRQSGIVSNGQLLQQCKCYAISTTGTLQMTQEASYNRELTHATAQPRRKLCQIGWRPTYPRIRTPWVSLANMRTKVAGWRVLTHQLLQEPCVHT